MLKFESPVLRAATVNGGGGGKLLCVFRMVLASIIFGRIKKIVKLFFVFYSLNEECHCRSISDIFIYQKSM